MEPLALSGFTVLQQTLQATILIASTEYDMQ